MKKSYWLISVTLVILITVFWQGCKKTTDEPSNWSAEDKASYEQAINVQDQAAVLLEEWHLTMDSLAAINKVKQYFEDDPSVLQVTVNSQGIAVQFKNGMRGGLFLDPMDEYGEERDLPGIKNPDMGDNQLKSIVNQRKMILINPHYYERSQFTDPMYEIHQENMERVNIHLSTFYKNEQAMVDRFTELSGYGIIQIYSHGWAWPKEENITDVYLLTGETVNEATSAKYWDELKKGNIPVMRVSRSNKYWISPKFIQDHNDFSKDTVLFYGGFCYSFLGDWPDVIDSFADGAYLGFDWSVRTYNNANWSVNLLSLMSNTDEPNPVTTEQWITDPGIPKSYWCGVNNRTVSIHYTGDGTLKLWQNSSVTASILALSSDGAPIQVAGQKNTTYSFKCSVNGLPAGNYSFIWNKDDGSNPVTVSNNTVDLSWQSNGTYTLRVVVKNTSSGTEVASTSATVTIGSDDDIFEFLHTLNRVTVGLYPGSAIHLSDGSSPTGTFEYNTEDWNMNAAVQWSGNGFSIQGSSSSGENTIQISGTLSEDGRSVSTLTATRKDTRYQLESKITFVNLVSYYSPGNVDIKYLKPSGSQTNDHVTITEYKRFDSFNQTWVTLQSIDWAATWPEVRFYKK